MTGPVGYGGWTQEHEDLYNQLVQDPEVQTSMDQGSAPGGQSGGGALGALGSLATLYGANKLAGAFSGGSAAASGAGAAGASGGAGAVASQAPTFAGPQMALPTLSSGGAAGSAGTTAAATTPAASGGLGAVGALGPLALFLAARTGVLNKPVRKLLGDKEANRTFIPSEAAQSKFIGGQAPGFNEASQSKKEDFVTKLNELQSLALPGRNEDGKNSKIGQEYIMTPEQRNYEAVYRPHDERSMVFNLKRPTVDEMSKNLYLNDKGRKRIEDIKTLIAGLGQEDSKVTGIRPVLGGGQQEDALKRVTPQDLIEVAKELKNVNPNFFQALQERR